MKLTVRLVLVLLFLSLLPLAAVGVLSYATARGALVAAAQDRLVTVNELKYHELERWLDGNLYDLQALAQRPLLVDAFETMAASLPASDAFQTAHTNLLTVHLGPRQQLEEGIATIYVLDASTGRVLAALDPALEGQDLSGADVFRQGLQGPYIGPLAIPVSGGQTMLDIATPIVNADGEVVGVLAGTLDPAILNEIMTSISGVSQTQETYVVNAEGEVVTSLSHDPENIQSTLHTQAVDSCLARQDGMGIYPDYRNVPVIGTYHWLPDVQACLITEVDVAEALTPATALRSKDILAMLIAAGVVTALGVLFARGPINMVHQLVDGTAEIGRGNLAYRIDSNRTDELGRLALMFNLMADDLDAGQRALREANETLERQVHERTAALAYSLEELGDSETRYRTLFDNVPVGLYRTTIDGRLLDANPALVDMLGFPDKETLLAIDIRSTYGDSEQREDQLRRLEATNILRNFTYQVRCYDGSLIWVEDTMQAIRDEAGAIQQLEGSLQDITERRNSADRERDQWLFAEALTGIAAAMNSTLALNDLLDQILDAVAHIVPHDSAHILLLNGGSISLVRSRGRNADEMLADRERVDFSITATHTFQTMLKSKAPLLIDDIRQYQGWMPLESRDWVRAYLGAPIVVNDEVIGFLNCDSSQVGIYGEIHAQRLQAFADQVAIALHNSHLFEQITDNRDNLERLVEESTVELRQAKEHIEAILSNNADPILLLSPDGLIQISNPAYGKLFGAKAAQAHDASLLDVIPPDDQPALRQVLKQVGQEHHTARLELVTSTHDGTPIDIELALAPIEEDGDLVSLVCSLRDITGLKDMERMKDAFISMAAHELRTPLTSIRGFSEILLHRTLETEQQRRYLGFINEQSEELNSIIDNLLDVARLKAGRSMKLTLQLADLGQIIRAIVGPIATATPRTTFALTGLDDLPPVFCDRKRIGQVMLNLITNAIKYSPEGGQVTIDGQRDDDYMVLRVSDPGIGMTTGQLSRAFDPFYRADTSNSAQEGTGLGLAIGRMIVEAHGGTISASSTYGKGSTFTVRLPIQPPTL